MGFQINTDGFASGLGAIGSAMIQVAQIKQQQFASQIAGLLTSTVSAKFDDPEELARLKEEYATLFPGKSSIEKIQTRGDLMHYAFQNLGIIDPSRAEAMQNFFIQAKETVDKVDTLAALYATPEMLTKRLQMVGVPEEYAPGMAELLWGFNDGTNQGLLDMHNATTGVGMEFATLPAKAMAQATAELKIASSAVGQQLYELNKTRELEMVDEKERIRAKWQMAVDNNQARNQAKLQGGGGAGWGNEMFVVGTAVNDVAEFKAKNDELKKINGDMASLIVQNGSVVDVANTVLYESDKKNQLGVITYADYAFLQTKAEGDPKKLYALLESRVNEIDPAATNDDVRGVIAKADQTWGMYDPATQRDSTEYLAMVARGRSLMTDIETSKPKLMDAATKLDIRYRALNKASMEETGMNIAQSTGLMDTFLKTGGIFSKEEQRMLEYITGTRSLAQDVQDGTADVTSLLQLSNVYQSILTNETNPAVRKNIADSAAALEEFTAKVQADTEKYKKGRTEQDDRMLSWSSTGLTQREVKLSEAHYAQKFANEVVPKLAAIESSVSMTPEQKQELARYYVLQFKREYLDETQALVAKRGLHIDQEDIPTGFIQEWLGVDYTGALKK